MFTTTRDSFLAMLMGAWFCAAVLLVFAALNAPHTGEVYREKAQEARVLKATRPSLPHYLAGR